jgi:hypothetical protein
MNPNTNKFEELHAQSLKDALQESFLVRPDGTPVPKTWSIFSVGEIVTIKDYTFKVAYIGESNILFEPVGPVVMQTE